MQFYIYNMYIPKFFFNEVIIIWSQLSLGKIEQLQVL